MNEIEKVSKEELETEVEIPERNYGVPQITEMTYKNGQARIVVELIGGEVSEGVRHILCLNPQEVLATIRWKSGQSYTSNKILK